MEFGAHLPVLSLAGERFSIGRLTSYARAASQLGYTVLCANDHLVYNRPHLDSLTSLAVVIESSGQMKMSWSQSYGGHGWTSNRILSRRPYRSGLAAGDQRRANPD